MPVVLLLASGVVFTHIANIRRIVRGQEKAVIKPVRMQRQNADGADQGNPLEQAPGGKDSPAPPLWKGKAEDPLDEMDSEEVPADEAPTTV